MPEKAVLPYKAINVYMEQDYLESVVKSAITGVKKLSKQDQIDFSQFMKKHVNVLGFRDPSRAPVSLQVRALAKVFEEKDEVIPFVLSTWVKVNKKFVKPVRTWLEAEGFKDLQTEREFEEESGFVADWPKKLSFDQLAKKFKKDNPDIKINQDDLTLMVLWMTGQLPND